MIEQATPTDLDTKLAEHIDAARQTAADHTQNEAGGSTVEHIAGPNFGDSHIMVTTNKHNETLTQSTTDLPTTTGTAHYGSEVRDYDYKGQPRNSTHIIKTDETGQEVFRLKSQSPKLARN